MEENKTQQYELILRAFEDALELVANKEEDLWYVIEVLSEIRARYLFSIVADEMMLSYEYAIKLVYEYISKNGNEAENQRAMVLASAMENLVDFAVYQQYNMIINLPENIDLDDEDVEMIFERYNLRYAKVEDDTVEQAAKMAFIWSVLDSDTVMQYTTQRDERVRYEHAALDGIKYKKSEFPAELIPPIDYNCRCFLVETGETGAGSEQMGNLTYWAPYVNKIFSESLATGGKVFNDYHPYFDVEDDEHDDELKKIKKTVMGRMTNI